MPLVKYDFLPDIYQDPDSKTLKVTHRPYVLIKLGNGNRWSKNYIKSLVDSGADNNVFPASFATEIGINYQSGRFRKITGVGGQEIDSYINIVKLKIDKREIETTIHFGESIQTPLLGREGFFNYFNRLSFDVKHRKLELKY